MDKEHINGQMADNIMGIGKTIKCKELKIIFLSNKIKNFFIRDGSGEFTWSDGRKYVGDYFDDK
jgi:hypothetical protein